MHFVHVNVCRCTCARGQTGPTMGPLRARIATNDKCGDTYVVDTYVVIPNDKCHKSIVVDTYAIRCSWLLVCS